MTDEVHAAMPADEAPIDTMEKAKAGGYVEPAAPSHEERIAALVADVGHAMTHNAPVSIAMFAELKELLGYVEPEVGIAAEPSAA